MQRFLFIISILLMPLHMAVATPEVLTGDLVEISDTHVDYEIIIVDDPEELENWAQELRELDELPIDASLEDLKVYEYLEQLLPEVHFIPTAPKAMKRTCAALEAPGASEGIASWYGDNLHGGPTASGERFNQNDLTAAHKTIPFNSIVEVTYKGRKVRVRINDAGPYYGNRIIDLSKEAARQLGMVEAGIGRVKLVLISCGKKSNK